MKTALKLSVILFLVLVMAFGGALLALPHLLSSDLVKNRITAMVEQKTGRRLSIAGETSFRIWPRLAVSLDDISLSGPPDMQEAPLITMKALRANLKLMPLLKGQADIDSISLVEPRFNLLVDKAGRQNWDFDQKGNNSPASKSAPPSSKGLQRLSLGKVTIKDGFASYRNLQDNRHEEIKALNVILTQHPQNRSIDTSGRLHWRDQPIAFEGQIASLDDLARGQPSMIQTKISSRLASGKISGRLDPRKQARPILDGLVSLSIPSLRELAAMTGTDLPAGQGFGALEMSAKVKAGAENVQFATTDMRFDGMNIAVRGNVRLQKPRPHITADMDIDRLDLNLYSNTAETGKQDSTGGPGDNNSNGSSNSSGDGDMAVDLSFLRSIDGRFSISARQILVKKARLENGQLKMVIKDGRAHIDIGRLALYRGSASGKIVLDGSGSTGFVAGSLSMKDILTGALLRDFAGFDKLAGTGSLKGDFASSGNSTKALKRALDGRLDLLLVNGRIEGFDLARYVGGLTGQTIPGSPQSTSEKPMTAYDRMSAIVHVSKGVARNRDFLLTGKFFRVRAAGSSDLVNQSLRFRIAPKLFSGNWSFAPPLRVDGTWSNPRVKFDAVAFLGGSDRLVDSLGGLLRGKKLDLDKVLKNRGLQTDAEIEAYLQGRKIDTSLDRPAGDKPANEPPEQAGKGQKPGTDPAELLKKGLGGLLGGDDKKNPLGGLFGR